MLTFAIGYGSEVFTYGGNYSIIPCTAPFVGALIGGAIYDILIFTGDSPFNRKHFGLDEWRWKKTVMNPLDELADALPDGLTRSRTGNNVSETSEPKHESFSTNDGLYSRRQSSKGEIIHHDSYPQLQDPERDIAFTR